MSADNHHRARGDRNADAVAGPPLDANGPASDQERPLSVDAPVRERTSAISERIAHARDGARFVSGASRTSRLGVLTGSRAPQAQLPPELRVVVHAAREVIRVAPSGELDIATVDQLRHEAEELIAAGFPRVVIDLRALTFIDCAGLHLLGAMSDAAQRAECHLSYIPGPAAVHRVFELTNRVHMLKQPERS